MQNGDSVCGFGGCREEPAANPSTLAGEGIIASCAGFVNARFEAIKKFVEMHKPPRADGEIRRTGEGDIFLVFLYKSANFPLIKREYLHI